MSDLLVNGGHIDGVTRWHVSSSKVSDIGSILNQLSTSISCGHSHRGVTLSLITRFVLQAITASWQKIYAVYGSDWSTVIARV